MEYKETLRLIEKVSEYGSVMGLDSIRELMARLGSPEEQLKIIHVAGTNGKGSTCAFLNSILMECGYTVGRFSTPDVFCYEEKFQINGKNMSREDLGVYYERVETICQQMTAESMQHPTLFEMETAIAVCYAADRNCDYLLLEVGMGGKTDATNYIKEPLVSVLTSVSMDHTEYLGNTLEEIARMKAGIMKKGRLVVSTWQEKPVREIFEKEAAKQNCPFYYVPKEKYESALRYIEQDKNGWIESDGTFEDKRGSLRFYWNDMTVTLPVTMQACYQVQNAMTALQTIDVIKEYDKEVIDRAADLKTADIKTGKPAVKITPECILAGIKKAVSPGRFMKILDQPEFYIDGAHNPGAAAELVKTLRFRFQDYSKVFIIGVFKDKDYDGMLRILSNIEAKIITVPLPPPRGLPADILAQAAKKYYPDVYCAKSISEAVEKAIEYAGEAENSVKNESVGRKGMILAFGSLSYLKEVASTTNYLKKLLEHPVYKEQMHRLERYESERVFCKHDFAHFKEMGRIAVAMMKKYGVQIEEETVWLAAYLHDMGRVAQYENGTPHDQAGTVFARRMLQEIGYPENKSEEIIALIDGHRSGGSDMPVRIFAWADKRSRDCYACEQTAACKWSDERKNWYAFEEPKFEQL